MIISICISLLLAALCPTSWGNDHKKPSSLDLGSAFPSCPVTNKRKKRGQVSLAFCLAACTCIGPFLHTDREVVPHSTFHFTDSMHWKGKRTLEAPHLAALSNSSVQEKKKLDGCSKSWESNLRGRSTTTTGIQTCCCRLFLAH